ncbi:MAG: ParB/RepB/Spo0J family partition protein [Candidatus Omnitrophica bacterium]|nr:ParB/RepB/Spo0J family partition protein [Candidatus Omnitrophota bacterium]
MKQEMKWIKIEEIILGHNIRGVVKEADVQDILPSIQKEGVLQPVLVTMRKGKYLLCFGFRRFKAAQLAKRGIIPATIKELTDEDIYELQMIENLQRKDLDPIQEAESYKELSKRCQLKDLVVKTGRSEKHIKRYLQLLTLPMEVITKIKSGELSAGHGFAIAQLGSKQGRLNLLKEIIRDRMSIRQAEREISGRDYTERLENAPFDKTECAGCQWNGNAQKALFLETVNLTGECRNKKCYRSKLDKWIKTKAEDFKKKGFKVKVVGENFWQFSPGRTDEEMRDYSQQKLGKSFKELCLKPCEKMSVFIVSDGDIRYVCNNNSCLRKLTRVKSSSPGGGDSDARAENRIANRVNITIRNFMMRRLEKEVLRNEELRNILILESLIKHDQSGELGEFIKKSEVKVNKRDREYIEELGITNGIIKQLVQMSPKYIKESIREFSKRFLVQYSTGELITVGEKAKMKADEFRVDEAYLMKMTKAELGKLAKELDISKKELPNPNGKKKDLVKWLLARPETKKKAPKEIVKNRLTEDED